MPKDKAARKDKKAKPAKAAKPKKKVTASKVKAKAAELASNPLVAEVVAATLVAAAAALRNPKKARQIASAAGEELADAAGDASAKGGAFWQLAMDVAKRSLDALADKPAVKSPKKKK